MLLVERLSGALDRLKARGEACSACVIEKEDNEVGKRPFTSAERYAVFTVHNEKCYMCGEPLDLLSMEVDHVIPETLLDAPEQLESVLTEYNLPAGFNLQSFANWLPACGPCNNRKRSCVFKATTRIQLDLDIAGEKAGQA